jgi:hypothetical protein
VPRKSTCTLRLNKWKKETQNEQAPGNEVGSRQIQDVDMTNDSNWHAEQEFEAPTPQSPTAAVVSEEKYQKKKTECNLLHEDRIRMQHEIKGLQHKLEGMEFSAREVASSNIRSSTVLNVEGLKKTNKRLEAKIRQQHTTIEEQTEKIQEQLTTIQVLYARLQEQAKVIQAERLLTEELRSTFNMKWEVHHGEMSNMPQTVNPQQVYGFNSLPDNDDDVGSNMLFDVDEFAMDVDPTPSDYGQGGCISPRRLRAARDSAYMSGVPQDLDELDQLIKDTTPSSSVAAQT